MNLVSSAATAYILESASSKVVVIVMDDSMIEPLEELGFFSVPGKDKRTLSLTTPDQHLKIQVFEKLRDQGVCFSGGPGWSPADVFEFLRDNKMLTGPYRKIIWRGPGEPQIIENC